MVVMETSLGTVTMELYEDKAPISVKNFLQYVDAEYYDGTIFHRVMSNFMIQGGGFDKDMTKKATEAPIKNEAGNGVLNEVGTLALARTPIVDSATSQFFINTKDNAFLNHRDKSAKGFGYAVFGRVTDGMDVVRKIESTPTGQRGGMGDVPVETVTIVSIRRK
ncbi:MAG: peptidylprolyl isomerase [Acidobacteriota bacterium]|nr:peptidylprolyl isomerase [Acidobacteriota bacterium]MDH3783819.1 peptidylprolyl isomerase [Acidobacteriota bacterium]